MSVKKFIAPQIALLFILSSVWIAGIDQVIVSNDVHQDNLHKYLQVQRRVIDNYFGDTNLSYLYNRSIVGIVKGLDKPEMDIEGTPIDTTASPEINNLRDSYNSFEEAYLYVANTYPEADMKSLTEGAIRSMLNTLDPHSVYIEADDSERIEEEFAGKFQGIGIQFNIIQDTITVITAISGGPSDQLGIMSGDRIISINDSSAIGYTNEDVMRKLRGEKGTSVDVEIQRPSSSNPFNLTIVRDDIPLTTIDTHYMLDEETGYIKINRFAATTHDEFLASLDDLKQQGMNRLMLDLRNNPGGYLSQAIAISEEFFPRGTKIVSTQSRHSRFNQEVVSRRDGSIKDTPVIVMVNEGSASASEIVSGAIQDHDRGLIVGRRTFGKGLVQQQYGLVDGSNIRVTISRYLTPSGRLIQKPFNGSDEDYAYEIHHRSTDASMDIKYFRDEVPDSLHYQTSAGRPVLGGGGIVPDFIIQEDTTRSPYLFNFMLVNRVDFNFVRDYLDQQGESFRSRWESDFQDFRNNFEWSQKDKAMFLTMMKEQGMEFSDDVSEPVIEDDEILKLSRETYDDLVTLNHGRLKAELARQVWGNEYFYPIVNDAFNETLQEAMKLWDEVEQLEVYAQQQAAAGFNTDSFD
ncbi:S41 family peptidase [Rhodohalobacter mucosus]|uniref:S41 family peptidase n=1 Tax=Rhodohalobacter mucosus TaxID=2079485 RepID=A0A316TTH9_9BACT|nr:S41 family peptidase [Rhodohalobacter mucosus]PWN06619.1 S41 family peptidase [Rhodohalobacter mucosus]